MAITVDDLKKLPTMYKILIGVGLVALILYFYYFYFFQAALEKKTALAETLENLEQQIAQRRVVAMKIEQHKKEIAELNKNLQIALAKLPEKKEIPALLRSVSEAGRTEGLSFLLFQPLEPASKEFYAELPIKIHLQGGYHDLTAFFLRVAELPRIINVADAIIRRVVTEEETEGNPLKTECLMKTYMFLEKADEKPTQAPAPQAK